MASPGRITAQLRRLDWARGLRAGLAVAAAMVVCRMLGLPMGWSALGAFEGNIVDNGGPYRVRFISIAMLMAGGSLGAVLASLASPHLAWALVLTAVFSFVITYLCAASPASTTSSVIILVVYFVGIDHPSPSLAGALSQAGLFLGGCALAAILSLFSGRCTPLAMRGGLSRFVSVYWGNRWRRSMGYWRRPMPKRSRIVLGGALVQRSPGFPQPHAQCAGGCPYRSG